MSPVVSLRIDALTPFVNPRHLHAKKPYLPGNRIGALVLEKAPNFLGKKVVRFGWTGSFLGRVMSPLCTVLTVGCPHTPKSDGLDGVVRMLSGILTLNGERGVTIGQN